MQLRVNKVKSIHIPVETRILAAAATLGEFRILELAAYAGANQNTVRSVISRTRNWFIPIKDSGPHLKVGRPSNHYRVKDVESIRKQVREMESQIEGLVFKLERENTEDCLAAIVVAESMIRRGVDPKRGWQERTILMESALESLDQAKHILQSLDVGVTETSELS